MNIKNKNKNKNKNNKNNKNKKYYVDKMCAICLENVDINENEKKLICDHVFHESCINEWKKYKNTCPICRYIDIQSPQPIMSLIDRAFNEYDRSVIERRSLLSRLFRWR